MSYRDRLHFYSPLDSTKSQGLPMAGYPPDAGKGAIYCNSERLRQQQNATSQEDGA